MEKLTGFWQPFWKFVIHYFIHHSQLPLRYDLFCSDQTLKNWHIFSSHSLKNPSFWKLWVYLPSSTTLTYQNLLQNVENFKQIWRPFLKWQTYGKFQVHHFIRHPQLLLNTKFCLDWTTLKNCHISMAILQISAILKISSLPSYSPSSTTPIRIYPKFDTF